MEIKIDTDLLIEKMNVKIEQKEKELNKKLELAQSRVFNGLNLGETLKQINQLEFERMELISSKELIICLISDDSNLRNDVLLKYI